jgi:GAF domain-containing protein
MSLEQAMAFVKSKAGTQFDPMVVQLLEEHFQDLEDLARRTIDEIEPLPTDLFIERGAAPGAGFASEAPEAPGAGSPSSSQARLDPLDLVVHATRESRAVFELGRLLGAAIAPEALCAIVAERMRLLVPYDCFAVYVKRDDSLTARFLAGPLANAFSTQPIPLGEGLSGWVADSERPIINGNPIVEPNFESGNQLITENSSALSIPLFNLEGVAFAVLTLYARAQAAFSKDHLRVLQALESNFALALENAFKAASMQPPTQSGLAVFSNPHEFVVAVESTAEAARLHRARFGVGLCTIASPSSAGENAHLQAVAAQLRQCSIQHVCRLSDNECEFLFSTEDEDTAAKLASVFEGTARRALAEAGSAANISVSVGTALYPQDGESVELLLGTANRRMHQRAEAQRETARTRALPALQGALS